MTFLGAVVKEGPSGLFKKVELQEPTFEHLVVVYRYQDKESPIDQLKQVFLQLLTIRHC